MAKNQKIRSKSLHQQKVHRFETHIGINSFWLAFWLA